MIGGAQALCWTGTEAVPCPMLWAGSRSARGMIPANNGMVGGAVGAVAIELIQGDVGGGGEEGCGEAGCGEAGEAFRLNGAGGSACPVGMGDTGKSAGDTG